MPQVKARSQSQEYIDIGEPKIRIQNDYLLPQLGEAQCKVSDDVCLTYSTLAAGYGQDSWT